MAANRTSAEDFVKIWQTSESVESVAEQVGASAASVSARASAYRKRGIPLKKMPKVGSARLDVSALAELAESL